MAENATEKESICTWVEPELAACVKQEAKDMAVSVAAVVRWALMERYDRQRAEWELRKLDGVPASP